MLLKIINKSTKYILQKRCNIVHIKIWRVVIRPCLTGTIPVFVFRDVPVYLFLDFFTEFRKEIKNNETFLKEVVCIQKNEKNMTWLSNRLLP